MEGCIHCIRCVVVLVVIVVVTVVAVVVVVVVVTVAVIAVVIAAAKYPPSLPSPKDYIGSLNWGYRTQLRDKDIKYFNAYGTFIDAHTVRAVDKKGKETILSATNILIATGGTNPLPLYHSATLYILFMSVVSPRCLLLV